MNGQSNAVVNSVGALQYYVSLRYPKSLEIPQGLLGPPTWRSLLPSTARSRSRSTAP